MSEAHETIGEYLVEHEPVQVIWHHLEGIVGHDESKPIHVEGLTLPASTIYLVGVFEGEVVKGGFRQLLSDHSGSFVNEILQALREVGAHVSVELLEKVLAVFTASIVPKDDELRRSLLAQLDQQDPKFFEPFDELYNQHVDAQSPHRVENINSLLLDYMKEHAAVRLSY